MNKLNFIWKSKRRITFIILGGSLSFISLYINWFQVNKIQSRKAGISSEIETLHHRNKVCYEFHWRSLDYQEKANAAEINLYEKFTLEKREDSIIFKHLNTLAINSFREAAEKAILSKIGIVETKEDTLKFEQIRNICWSSNFQKRLTQQQFDTLSNIMSEHYFLFYNELNKRNRRISELRNQDNELSKSLNRWKFWSITMQIVGLIFIFLKDSFGK